MEIITLKRIAQVLGLSISTVSRALKNHPDISAHTKKRVHELADTLDYEPNMNAISLRSKNNKVFGLIVPTISGFFYDSFISAIEQECRVKQYALMILQSSNDVEIEKSNIVICRQNRVSGLFVCLATHTTDFSVFEKFKGQNIPLVFFDKVPEASDYNKVCIADIEAATLAANALKTKNKKNILAIFGDKSLLISKTRQLAFADAMLQQTDVTIHSEYCGSAEAAKKTTHAYFSKKKKPDAVFCMSDEILIGVMKSLQVLNIAVPLQTGVIALSDGMLPTLYNPEITYIETSGYKLGKLAFSKMINCVAGDTSTDQLYTTSYLVKGGSI